LIAYHGKFPPWWNLDSRPCSPVARVRRPCHWALTAALKEQQAQVAHIASVLGIAQKK
jgi:hypothetical protein